MRQKFYKDIKLIKFCKECWVEYRPQRYTFFAMLGLCWVCRRKYYKRWYHEVWKPWFAKQPPEVQARHKKTQLVNWKVWVTRNMLKRQQQALASYHRRKHLHKDRKHIATKSSPVPDEGLLPPA